MANLKAHEFLFRAGFYGWLAIAALDVVVAFALSGVFRAVNAPLSLLVRAGRISE